MRRLWLLVVAVACSVSSEQKTFDAPSPEGFRYVSNMLHMRCGSLDCHGQAGSTVGFKDGSSKDVTIDPKAWEASVHGSMGASCHRRRCGSTTRTKASPSTGTCMRSTCPRTGSATSWCAKRLELSP